MRINVIGTSGSGKTTFGRQLAEVLAIPFLEMDALYWGPNWSQPADEDFFATLAETLEADEWVLDGNYTRTKEFKWDRVQAVIWINYSFSRTLYQAISRAVRRLFSKEELWPGTGNRERLDMLFSKDSIVWWTISSYHRHLKRNLGYMQAEQYSHIQFHRLRSPKEARQFLERADHDSGFILGRHF